MRASNKIIFIIKTNITHIWYNDALTVTFTCMQYLFNIRAGFTQQNISGCPGTQTTMLICISFTASVTKDFSS